MWDVLLSLGYALWIGLAVIGVAAVISYVRFLIWKTWSR